MSRREGAERPPAAGGAQTLIHTNKSPKRGPKRVSRRSPGFDLRTYLVAMGLIGEGANGAKSTA